MTGHPRHLSESHTRLDLAFPATPADVRGALSGVQDWLTSYAILDDLRASVELVLAEVLNNIVEHAYADAEDGTIDLRVDGREGGLDFQIHDGGKPMPDGVGPRAAGGATCPDPATLPEGGFGWFLVESLTHDLSYSREMGRNMLRFSMQPDQ